MTYTCATLEVSQAAFDEIAAKLREAGYDHCFDEAGMVDMTHIGLVRAAPDARHNKRGTSYAVLGEATVQASTAGAVRDGEQVVVYRGDVDGRLWVRPPAEFHDPARFTKL